MVHVLWPKKWSRNRRRETPKTGPAKFENGHFRKRFPSTSWTRSKNPARCVRNGKVPETPRLPTSSTTRAVETEVGVLGHARLASASERLPHPSEGTLPPLAYATCEPTHTSVARHKHRPIMKPDCQALIILDFDNSPSETRVALHHLSHKRRMARSTRST